MRRIANRIKPQESACPVRKRQQLPVLVVWAPSRKKRNQQQHALNGNMPSYCSGYRSEACIFSRAGTALQLTAGCERCAFCDVTVLKHKLNNKRTRSELLRQITRLRSSQSIAHAAFLERLSQWNVDISELCGKSVLCVGTEAGPCVFSVAAPGSPAVPNKGFTRCLFCDPDRLRQVHAVAPGRITALLAKLLQQNQEVHRTAVAIVANATNREVKDTSWDALLRHRQSVQDRTDSELQAVFWKRVAQDRRTVQRKFVPESESHKRKWSSEALRVPSDIKQPAKSRRRAGQATAPKKNPVDILSIATAQLAAKLGVHSADLLIPTPPDGLCFYHTLNAHALRETWMDGRLPSGFHSDRRVVTTDKQAAVALKERGLDFMLDRGEHARVHRLQLPGADGYPRDDDMQFFAEHLALRIHLFDLVAFNTPPALIGDHGPLVRIAHVGEHYVLINDARPDLDLTDFLVERPAPDQHDMHASEVAAAPLVEVVPAPRALVNGDVAENDCGLPAANQFPESAAIEAWCKFGSWAMCVRCHAIQPRPLQPNDAVRVAKTTVTAKACHYCKHGETLLRSRFAPPAERQIPRYYVPQPDDVPRPLRNLPASVLQALRPLDIDCGAYDRVLHGYRAHSAMIRFSWAASDVQKKIVALPTNAERQLAKKAYKYLMALPVSDYSWFVEEHRRWQRTDHLSQRPLMFIETPGLECALWPHLYWHRDMCETVERHTDVRRQTRARRAQRRPWQYYDEDDEDADQEPAGRHSIKRSFIRKVLSPVVDFAADYELLHFIFDLFLWSDVGAKKNMLDRMPLRLAMKGSSYSPAYWKARHLGVIDMQRQLGFPTLFKTQTVYEKSFPYHTWIMHTMRLCQRSRQFLAGPEVLHHAHVLNQMQIGYVTGSNHKDWSFHVFSDKRTGGATQTVNNFFHRLEFQDGKRRLPSQGYHGRGTVHAHNIDYLTNLEHIKLQEVICATRPREEPLRSYVVDCQQSRDKSQLLVQDRRSYFDSGEQRVHLQHTEEDHDYGLRPFIPRTLAVCKAHEDVQFADQRGALLRYVSTYTPKFSDSFPSEEAGVGGTAFSIAKRILFDYHPLEPEMWLILANHLVPICAHKGSMIIVVAPYAGMRAKPSFVERYERCRWRSEEMPLLEYLRKTNDQGQIVHWVEKLYKDTAPHDVSLEDFANRCPMKGEKLVSIETLSRMNDRFFGQWLALFVPFRRLDDFLLDDILHVVPRRFHHQACALRLQRGYWTSPDQIRADMELEAHGDEHIANVLHLVRAQNALIERYLSGEFDVRQEAVDHDDDEDVQRVNPWDQLDDAAAMQNFSASQKRLALGALKRIQHALDIRYGEDEETVQREELRLQEHGRILVGLGPPGCGKTYAVDFVINRARQLGARLLVCLPTGQLACDFREKHPRIEIDTIHGGLLLYKPLREVLPIMTQYDFIVIDELSQLCDVHFDFIAQLWEAAGRRPCLLLTGDFYQLPPIRAPGTSAIWESRFWNADYKHEILFDASTNFRITCPVLAEKLRHLRVSMPSHALFLRIVRHHKAWSGDFPSGYEYLQLMRRTERETTVVTCTRRAATRINDLALQVLFADTHRAPLDVIPADYESNTDNYDGHGNLRDDGRLAPLHFQLYRGSKVFLTKNLNKRAGFVNGMLATVDHYCAQSKCVTVLTRTGRRLAIFPFTEDVDTGNHKVRVVYYPMRPGYAGTIYKLQGANLKHVTVYLDRPGVPAAAYVAMSRVSRDEDYLLGGQLTPEHFVPAL